MSNIKAGFSRLCITPPLGTALSGYFEARYAKGVLDDLYATAVAFDDGKNRALVIALDLIDTDSKICDEYRRLISEYCGIPAEAVFINCSHTHTGPVVGIDKDSNTVGNPVYDEFLKLQDFKDLGIKGIPAFVVFKGEP